MLSIVSHLIYTFISACLSSTILENIRDNSFFILPFYTFEITICCDIDLFEILTCTGKNIMGKLILASASPRRINMLNDMGIKFNAVNSFYDEPERKKGQLPSEYVEANAEGKAKSVSKKLNKGIIVGSDTVVVYKNRVLGKPKNMNEAFEYIYLLNGKTHSVYTGLSIINCETGKRLSSHEKTLVTFRNLTESEITYYLNMIDPLDKAGAYAIQGEGALVVEKIKGCYYNVVGFPISKLESMLLDFGTSLFEYMKR